MRARQALSAAATHAYDVLILDRLTKGLDGLETLKRLRTSSGPSSDAPALMLTALAGERQRVEGLLGGADDYLSKPVGDEELLARIAAQLRRVAPSRQARQRRPGQRPLPPVAGRADPEADGRAGPSG